MASKQQNAGNSVNDKKIDISRWIRL